METDPVRAHSSTTVTQRLDHERLQRVARLADAPHEEVARHLTELDRSWDVERRLEANAATITLLGLVLAAAHSRKWLALSAAVPAFLLQHAIQGWCPPIEVFRRLGARTRGEIDAERTALKALRGDFEGLRHDDGDDMAAARRALDAAGRRH